MTPSPPTPADMAPYVERGLIKAREHDGLTIYNYTPRCQFDGAWDSVTTAARGLVYTKDGRLLTRPFPKFFNHSEPNGQVPPGLPDGVAVKYDGALGISYHWRGRNRWTTRGSLTSKEGAEAERLWRIAGDGQCPNGDRPLLGWTLLVEIVSPVTRQVVQHDFEGLVLLAARGISSGRYATRQELCALADLFGLAVADEVPVTTPAELAAAAAALPVDAEGWVARWGDHRVKFKGTAYKAMARLIAGLNPRRYADLWYAEATDQIARIPEEFRGDYEREAGALTGAAGSLQVIIEQLADDLRGLPPRAVASTVAGSWGPDLVGPVMATIRGEASDVRQLAYRRRHGKKPRPVMTARRAA